MAGCLQAKPDIKAVSYPSFRSRQRWDFSGLGHFASVLNRRFDYAPEALGSGGHFDVADPKRGEGVDDGIGDGG